MELKIDVWCQNCGANLNGCTFVKRTVERLELRVGTCEKCAEDIWDAGRRVGSFADEDERTQAMNKMFRELYGRSEGLVL